MSSIYPIRGQLWPQDNSGCVLNAATSREELHIEWSVLSELAGDLAQERFGDDLHSVYLSGPAARNRPGGGTFIVVLRPDITLAGSTGWAAIAAAELRRNAIGREGLKVTVLQWKDVFASKNTMTPARFRLAINSLCVAGRDLRRLIPAPELNASVANFALVSFEERLKTAKQKTIASENRARMRVISAETGHAILAAAFAIVMEAEQVYTEDLDMRRDLFALNFPELKKQAQAAYDMAALPSCDPVQVRAFINSATRWLAPLVNEWLNTHNPQRIEI